MIIEVLIISIWAMACAYGWYLGNQKTIKKLRRKYGFR